MPQSCGSLRSPAGVTHARCNAELAKREGWRTDLRAFTETQLATPAMLQCEVGVGDPGGVVGVFLALCVDCADYCGSWHKGYVLCRAQKWT